MTVSGLTIAAIMGILLLVFIFSGYYLFAALGGVAILSGLAFWGPGVFQTVYFSIFKYCKDYNLLAVPLFVLMGQLLNQSGVAGRLFDNLSVALGRQRGGMAIAATLIAILFAATTGIVGASVVSMGLLFVGPMLDAKYNKSLTAGVIVSGGTLGILIPPSNPMLVYGIIANVSISALFTAGFVPGALVGTCLMFTAYTIARRHGYKGTMHSYTMAEFGRALLKNIWSLMAPVVILGGIYAGICTPVEASVVAVWYALFVGFFITKKLSLKEVFNAMKLANISTGTILIVVGVSTIFGRFLTMYQIPQQLAAQMMLYTTNPILILLLIAALLFFLGMFMETLATIVVLAPVFLPIIKSVGIDPVFFGVFWVITNEIALLTPPLGVNLFIAMNLSNLPLERVAKGAIPYIFLLILVVFFLIFFPDVVTFLPKALGMY